MTGVGTLGRDGLRALTEAIDRCRLEGGCGEPHCGSHAVGKPTYQISEGSPILVVGEAPAASGWWITGRAFYSQTRAGALELSRTGVNLNECLATLNARIEAVGFVEAVRCRPSSSVAWRPGDRVRRKCQPFLAEHLRITQPLVILPMGQVPTASCLEIAFGTAPARLEDVVGKATSWQSPWGQAWILPLYHTSPANYPRWPKNRAFLAEFAADHPEAILRVPQ